MNRKNAEARSGPSIIENSTDSISGSVAENGASGGAQVDVDFGDVVESLSACAEDALSQAACGGIIDPAEVISWTEFARRLILYQRDRELLRAEVPELGQGLVRLLSEVDLPNSSSPDALAMEFMRSLAEMRSMLALDVEAAYQGDPASQSFAEIAVAYPSLQALTVHRIAHRLTTLGVPMLPRIMSEYAHSTTGIDIHPGATIGLCFFIDHGTGVVIGETAEIGNGVRLYQGVTLGAASLRDGPSLRGRKRHPTVEDDVTIYAGATILGGGTVIGKGSVIGGNVWITDSVPPGSHVVAEAPHQAVRGENPASAEQLKWDL